MSNLEFDKKNSIYPGEHLPHPIAFGTVVRTRRSFLIVGGNDGNGQLDTIYKYLAREGKWRELTVKLPRPAEKLTATIVGWDVMQEIPGCNEP